MAVKNFTPSPDEVANQQLAIFGEQSLTAALHVYYTIFISQPSTFSSGLIRHARFFAAP